MAANNPFQSTGPFGISPPPATTGSASRGVGGFGTTPTTPGTGFRPLPPEFSTYLFNTTPGAAISHVLSQAGLGPMGGLAGRYLHYNSPLWYNAYTAQAATNPQLNFVDYLNQQMPSINTEWELAKPLSGGRPIAPRQVLG